MHVILYEDHSPYEIPEELKLCLLEEPYVYDIFEAYTDGKRKQSRNGYILQNQSKLRQNGLQKSLVILSIKIPGTEPGKF